ncbi:MAG: ribonuclease HI family protein [Patescibacteria group bacterium]
MTKFTIHTDGASRGNPGDAAIAYVIVASEPLSTPLGHTIKQDNNLTEYCQRIGQTTNNQAEYRALDIALDKLLEMSIAESSLEFYADSELMIKQLMGEYRVKDPALRPLFDSIKSKLERLTDSGNIYTLSAIRRQFNKRADELANYALDNHRS